MRHLQRQHRAAVGEPLRITWVSDTHVLAESDGNAGHPKATRWAPPNSNYLYQASWRAQQVADRVEALQPDYHVDTGDIADEGLEDDFLLWKPAWESISVPKDFTPGNVDFTAAGLGYAGLVNLLGYGGRVENADSVFNVSRSVTGGDVTVRLIMVDTTRQSDGTRGAHQGSYPAAARTWLQNELLACDEEVALIFGHHAPHLARFSEFSSVDASALETMFGEVRAARPNLRVHWFYGHQHNTKTLIAQHAPGVQGRLGPAVVQYEHGSFMLLRVYRNGVIQGDAVRLPAYA